MNGHGTALQRIVVAGAVAGVLWGASAAGPPAQGAPARPPVALNGVPLQSPLANMSIIDGAPASITEFPFQVALYDPRLGGPGKGFFCGGVILDARRVATAAHCLIGEGGHHSAPGEIEVLAGSSDLAPPDAGSVEDPVASAAIDPAYQASSSDYDVGLLQLARPLWSGAAPVLDGHSTIAPLVPDLALAGLGSAAGPTAPTQALVSGWGDLNAEPGAPTSYPLRLRRARVPLVSDGLCEEAYATIEQAITPPEMLCAGRLPRGGTGTHRTPCYGDSGGPPGGRAGSTGQALLSPPGTYCWDSWTSATAAGRPAIRGSTCGSPTPPWLTS